MTIITETADNMNELAISCIVSDDVCEPTFSNFLLNKKQYVKYRAAIIVAIIKYSAPKVK